MREPDKVLWRTLEVMCPSFPRKFGFRPEGYDGLSQPMVSNKFETVDRIQSASEESPSYISVYAFPEGHSKDGNAPLVDTAFFDFDIAGDSYYHLTGEEDDWKRSMNSLLDPITDVARELVVNGMDGPWRAVLSGHKGVHFYLDFPAVEPDTAPQEAFRTGLQRFVDNVTDSLDSRTPLGLAEFKDVDSADLGRICRIPNTLHPEATESFGEERYCVPVTMEELIGLDAEGYAELTRSRRLPASWGRVGSKKARLTLRQHLLEERRGTPPDGGKSTEGGASNSGGEPGQVDMDVVTEYRRKNRNRFDTLDDIWWLLKDKPCMREYYDRDDQFRKRQQSHLFELFVMTHLLKLGVNYDLMVEFFRDMEGFSEKETKDRLNQLISRGYHLDSESGGLAPVSCERVWEDAPEFCLESDCRTYRLNSGE